MANDAPKVGQLVPDGERRRDAIHVAVVPATLHRHSSAAKPGEHVGIAEFLQGEPICDSWEVREFIGVIDPFLKEKVRPGQRFWLFLYPESITSLRHYWTHPVFAAAAQREADKAKEDLLYAVRSADVSPGRDAPRIDRQEANLIQMRRIVGKARHARTKSEVELMRQVRGPEGVRLHGGRERRR